MGRLRAIVRHLQSQAVMGLDSHATRLANACYRRSYYVRALRQRSAPLRLVIGAGGTRYEGWLSSNVAPEPAMLPRLGQVGSMSIPLDITDADQWSRVFDEGTIDRMLCEHVLEHLSDEQLSNGLALCRKHLAPGGRLRIAVPDGHRPDSRYLDAVAPPVDGHLQLFTIESLSLLLHSVGFGVEPLEYYDHAGSLHRLPYDEDDGIVLRCYTRDRQIDFAYADHNYTSLIVDAVQSGG